MDVSQGNFAAYNVKFVIRQIIVKIGLLGCGYQSVSFSLLQWSVHTRCQIFASRADLAIWVYSSRGIG
eukprot:2150615-Ditylum_brightwellii.AAC.1